MMRRSESSVKERKAYTKREIYVGGNNVIVTVGNKHVNSNINNLNMNTKTKTRS